MFDCVDLKREIKGKSRFRRMHFGPRGFLKFYILHLLQYKPMSGYELMNEIERRTFGAWRPTSGSIYPTLMELLDRGEIEETPSEEEGKDHERGKRTYKVTEKGEERLEQWKRTFEKMRERITKWRAFWMEFFPLTVDGSLKDLEIIIKNLGDKLSTTTFSVEEKSQLLKRLNEIRSKIEEIAEKVDRGREL